jgi:hypothetical protein
MSANDSPFSALDKMLFSSTPMEKEVQKKVKSSRRRKKINKLPAKKTTPAIDQPSRPVESTGSVNKSSRSIDPIGQANQTDQSTRAINQEDQSTGQLMGAVAKRPLGFYIPTAINEHIDEAVLFFQKKYNQKIDRSAVVSAILGDPKIWRKPSLDKLAGRVKEEKKQPKEPSSISLCAQIV